MNKIFEVIAGSHAYGTNIETSDIDIRGIYMDTLSSHLDLFKHKEQVADSTNDIVHYELKRFMQLASACNPNIIELLWTPKDCIKKISDEGAMLLQNRHLFISKKALDTFGGYSHAQIKKAKGRNKWVNNPKPEDPPVKEDFCWILPFGFNVDEKRFAARPVPLMKHPVRRNIKNCKASKVEHMENTYRLYMFENHDKGPFRGNNIVVDSISIEEESRFVALLIFNKIAYESAYKDWKNYWDWRKNRNDARWESQEKGDLDYDQKNMMHCVRLLWSGINILENGEPIVRFDGDRLKILMDIRHGHYKYDDLMVIVDDLKNKFDSLKDTSTLPKKSNMDEINKLFFQMHGLTI